MELHPHGRRDADEGLLDRAAVLDSRRFVGLVRRLRALPHLNYISADLNPASIAMVQADITSMPFGDETFDVVICNHVLEHVSDDRKAIGELYRVLKPGGRVYMMHPVSKRERTDESATVTGKAERRRRFGQKDHVRLYGQDFIQRNEEAGFETVVGKSVRRLFRRALKSTVQMTSTCPDCYA